jgi:hypothetical protein
VSWFRPKDYSYYLLSLAGGDVDVVRNSIWAAADGRKSAELQDVIEEILIRLDSKRHPEPGNANINNCIDPTA